MDTCNQSSWRGVKETDNNSTHTTVWNKRTAWNSHNPNTIPPLLWRDRPSLGSWTNQLDCCAVILLFNNLINHVNRSWILLVVNPQRANLIARLFANVYFVSQGVKSVLFIWLDSSPRKIHSQDILQSIRFHKILHILRNPQKNTK